MSVGGFRLGGFQLGATGWPSALVPGGFTGLLDQFSGAAAAYSLRKLSKDTTNVVRVRRSSDDTEQDFTANQVSDGSLVDWTGGWYNSGFENFSNPVQTARTGFTAENTNSIGLAFLDISGLSGESVEVTFDLSLTSGSPSISLRSGTSTVSNLETFTTGGSKTVTLTATGNFDGIAFSEGDVPSEFTVSNFTHDATDSFVRDGFVTTWYDQSGNGRNATQATTTDQPQIVDSGSLVTGGIDFDGAGDTLTFTGPTTTAWTLACVTNIVGASGGFNQVFGTGATANEFVLGHATVVNSLKLRTLINNDTNFSIAEPTGQILAWSNTSGNGTITLGVDGSALQSNTGHETNFSQTVFSFGFGNFDGTINEAIFYSSNEIANRTAIETNIADAYGITLA